MKRIGLTSATVALTLAMAVGGNYVNAQAQGGAGGSTTARPGGASASSGQADTRAGQSDARDFVNQMAIAGIAEVQLGKMAASRASNADVKAFGQMMVKDHTQANLELTQVASRSNLQPQKELDQKHRDLSDRLSKLKGAEFDREYMNAMVQGHEEVAAQLRSHAGDQSTSTQTSGADRSTAASGARRGAGATGGSTASSGSAATSGRGTGAVGTAGSGSGEQALSQWAAKTLPTVQHHLERAREVQQKLK